MKSLEDALTPADVVAANALTKRWLLSGDDVPAAASGLGVWALLAVLATGAVEDTEEELLAALGIPAERAAAVPAALLDGLRATESIRLAVAAWADATLMLDADWVASLPADVVGVFTGDAVADEAALDAWAARNTQGLIEKMPLDLDATVMLVLASALSVRTEWLTTFENHYDRIAEGPWAHFDRPKLLTAEYCEPVLRVGANASVLTVPGEDDVDVLLAIGRPDTTPSEVAARLLAAANDPDWGRAAADLAPGGTGPGVRVVETYEAHPQTAPETIAYTAAFEVAADLDLLTDAGALGLELASDLDLARFDRLAAQALYVSQAKQTCVASFDATGFDAAAVTGFGMAFMGGLPPEPEQTHRHVKAVVSFDRPFAYLARHRPTGLVLVAGWVAEPALH
ncbi:serpin family protein [Glycomyces sp. NPDC046736]|uniref:serpin family protein n=1 Tax=Glycomyces sp. NPDC046736 TaxID=3155615 RepID=UPI0033CA869E